MVIAYIQTRHELAFQRHTHTSPWYLQDTEEEEEKETRESLCLCIYLSLSLDIYVYKGKLGSNYP